MVSGGIDHARIFAVLLNDFRTDDCMTILIFFIGCFTEIVKKPCALGDCWSRPISDAMSAQRFATSTECAKVFWLFDSL